MILIFKILLEFLLIFHFCSATPSLWTIPNLFFDNSIQFVVRYDKNSTGKIDQEPPYFHPILSNNPYSTIQFNHFFLSRSKIYGFTGLGLFARSQKQLATFLHLSGALLGETYGRLPAHFVLQKILLKCFNPQYLFQHSDDPSNPLNYWGYYAHSGTSKVILFNFNTPQVVLTPFIPSSLVPPLASIITKDFSLSNLEAVWNSLNRNLLMRDVSVVDPLLHNLAELDCAITVSSLEKNTIPELCRILFLSRIHNFSIVDPSQADNAISSINLRGIFEDFIGHDRMEYIDVFKLVCRPVKFAIVTHYRSEFQGMYAFLLPFEAPVWVTLLLFCISVTWFIQLLSKKGKVAWAIIDDFLMVTAILLSQTNGDSFKLFRGRNTVAVPVLTVWFLAGCNIITNNLYTGEIFSYLTATKEPAVPTSLSELVDYNTPIITSTRVRVAVNVEQSLLKMNLIPSFVHNLDSNQGLEKLCLRLIDRLKFIGIVKDFKSMQKFLSHVVQSKSFIYSNISFPVEDTFAVMDDTKEVEFITEVIKVAGGRLVINGQRENTPFSYLTIDTLHSNFLSPIFRRSLSHLEAMGVDERWGKLAARKMIGVQLNLQKNRRYRFYFSRKKTAGDPLQEARPVSVANWGYFETDWCESV
ncbi:hypothetical protein Fcan01_22829 [Folsomia candida]|uniref:Uncharacterized protein n=1 Tax=Folsomia candida TaxID=158441 RepID=A0A226DB30_FOLCA|nr:hypothetical protein Fcan01_22829 [Folsomia candida]